MVLNVRIAVRRLLWIVAISIIVFGVGLIALEVIRALLSEGVSRD